MALDPSRLWTLNSAARLAGVTAELLASAIAHGDVPGVEIISLGPKKIRYVRAEPFLAWIEGPDPVPPTPAAFDPIADLLKD